MFGAGHPGPRWEPPAWLWPIGPAFVLALGSALGISALAVAHENASIDCMVNPPSLPGITMSYLGYLMFFGVSVLACNAIATCFVCGSKCFESYDSRQQLMNDGFFWVVGISSCFQFLVFVVGSAIYFTQVFPHCPATSSIFVFGIALFIIQFVLSFVAALILLCLWCILCR